MESNLDQATEERLRELSRRVANAARMSYQSAREAIVACMTRHNIPQGADVLIRKQLDEIFKHIHKKPKGRFWYREEHRRELVTRHSPRLLFVHRRHRRKRK